MPLRTFWRSLYSHPLRGWFLFFFLIQLGLSMPPSTNPLSRWTAMAAMTEDGTPRIDSYYTATIDWARTPDGHYFSNKAPGPMLLGEPIFAYLDAWQTRGVPNRDDRDRIRYMKCGGNLRLLSLIFQIVPLFLLSLWMMKFLEKSGASRAARTVAFLALLFGNTACIFLNQYFGHGCAAVCALALYLAVLSDRVMLSAFFFGLGMLCEYSGALLFFPLLPIWISSFRRSGARGRWLLNFVGGAITPAVAWVAYHSYCFGSPFRIPNQFQNPLFVEQATDRVNVGGIFFLPSWEAVWGLTLGDQRGLLFTQPWALFLLVGLLALKPLRQKVFSRSQYTAIGLPLVFFALLFLMNSAFGGWHGGGTSGPRYLSAGLVLLAPVLGLLWDKLTPVFQNIGWGLVGISVCFQLVFMSVYLALANPGIPLWKFYWDELHGVNGATPALRMAITIPIALALLYRAWAGRLEPKSSNKKANFSPAARH
jgi:hypothetical protein